MEFKASVKLAPNDSSNDVFVYIELNESDNITYDEVEYACLIAIDNEFKFEYYPYAKIDKIFVKDNNANDECSCNWFPAISESEYNPDDKLAWYNKHLKIFVLPDAVYSLSPEYMLFRSLVDKGICDENSFDYECFHEILNDCRKIVENDKIS